MTMYRIYAPTGEVVANLTATSEDAALLAYIRDEGYQAGDVDREAETLARRAEIDAAKAAFAASRGLTGASNSAITKAWRAAGSPR